MNEIKQYMRDNNNLPVGVMVGRKIREDLVLIGWSRLHWRDQWNPKKGCMIADNRIKKGHSNGIIMPAAAIDLDEFLDRCCRFFQLPAECIHILGVFKEDLF